ncbi:MAG: SIS domain-containing protein [Defluviitaleaceae bacterium]|nr:SIS domain-containing protein [Defluviitaleaceae bacterium]
MDDYLRSVADALIATDAGCINGVAEKILMTKQKGSRIFTAGNGGSAATASHFCNDLVKGCRTDGAAGFDAMCLCDPVPVVTCLANDFSYDEIFSLQLETHARRGDLLVIFSGSGNSPNILKAARYAASNQIGLIGFGGRDGGSLAGLCENFVLAPSWSMEEIEDLHLCYCHSIIVYIKKRLSA